MQRRGSEVLPAVVTSPTVMAGCGRRADGGMHGGLPVGSVGSRGK